MRVRFPYARAVARYAGEPGAERALERREAMARQLRVMLGDSSGQRVLVEHGQNAAQDIRVICDGLVSPRLVAEMLLAA